MGPSILQLAIQALPPGTDPALLEGLATIGEQLSQTGLVRTGTPISIQPMGSAPPYEVPPIQPTPDAGTTAPPRRGYADPGLVYATQAGYVDPSGLRHADPGLRHADPGLRYTDPGPRYADPAAGTIGTPAPLSVAPEHGLASGVTLRTPKGKMLRASDVKDAEVRMQKRKEPTFDSSYKYDVKKGFRPTIKAIHDRLFRSGISYVFNLAGEPFEADKKDQAFDIADERSVMKIDGETVHDLDQSTVFDWLQQAFSEKFPEIFQNIKSSDYLCGTTAYDKLRKKLNPINPRIQIEKKNRFKEWLGLPLGSTTWETHEHLLVKYRLDLQAANADVKPHKIMYLTVDALRKTGTHWTSFMENHKVQHYLDISRDLFSEDDLTGFFTTLQQREYDLLGDTKAAQRGKKATDAADPEQSNLASHLASGRKPGLAQKKFCPFHKREVAHSEEDCSLNPKNKGKAPPSAGKAGGGTGKANPQTAGGSAKKTGNSDGKHHTAGHANVVCYKCKQKGHIKANCPDASNTGDAPTFAGFVVENVSSLEPDAALLCSDDRRTAADRINVLVEHLRVESANDSFDDASLHASLDEEQAQVGQEPVKMDSTWNFFLNRDIRLEALWRERHGYPNPFDPKLMKSGGWRIGDQGLPPPEFFKRADLVDSQITSEFFLDDPKGYSLRPAHANIPNDAEDGEDDEDDDVPDLIDPESSDDEQLEDQAYMACVTEDADTPIDAPCTTVYFAGCPDGVNEVIADSGATITLLQDRAYFDDEDFVDCETTVQTAGTDGSIQAVGKGMATLQIEDPTTGEVGVTVKVHALLCPGLRRDLLSIPSLCAAGFVTQFGPDQAFITSSDGRQQAPLQKRGKLWIAQIVRAMSSFAGAVSHLTPEQIWHLWTNHINFDALCRGSARARGMPTLTKTDDCVCHDCWAAKARRTGPGHLGSLMDKVCEPLELVFGDLSGPMRVPALGPHGEEGFRYSLILVDCLLKKKWDIPLRKKNDAAHAFEQWVAGVQALIPRRVRRVHTDQGGEFMGKAFQEVCERLGILHHTSTAYESRQNGTVERSIGTLTRLARTMLRTSNAPLHLWWFARSYASEILNAFPMDGKCSADEIFYQEPPDASMFFPFGSFCFAYHPRHLVQDRKWDIAGEEGIIVGTGFSAGKRAFAVYTRSRKIVYAISVRVDMTYFPFRKRGQQRIDSAYFQEHANTEEVATWDNHQFHRDHFDAVFVPPTEEGTECLDYSEPSWNDITTSDAAPDDPALISDLDIETAISQAKTLPLSNEMGSGSGNNDSPAADKDLTLPDGRWAPDLIGSRVTKWYKHNNSTYHGTVVDLEFKPNNKNKIVFSCFFDEDQDYDYFTYPQLLKILDEAPGELANVAEVAEVEVKSDYVPDVIPTRAEMLAQPDFQQFLEAERVEIANMEKHEVLEWCVPPKGARLVSSKFTYKRRPGKPHKARIVARGFSMEHNVDYLHSSSPVATSAAFRLLLAVAVTLGMDVSSGDIDGAFLNAELSEDLDVPLYMSPPAGFQDPTGQGRAFLVKRSIYGLKNASYCWFKTLSAVMKELGYHPIDGSECLWMFNSGNKKAIFCVHVDDYVLAYTDAELNTKLVSKFTELWGVSGTGPLKTHLGMEIDFVKGKHAIITQKMYFEKVLRRFGFATMKSVDTPMESTLKISLEDTTPDNVLDDNEKRQYMEIIGSLLYGAVMSRPDIANAVAQLGRVMSRPNKTHLSAAKRVLRYIAGTLDRGLRYENKDWYAPGVADPLPPRAVVTYADSDWAGDVDTRKSMSGYLIFMAGGVISYRSKMQSIQALSSAEAEYVALSDAARDVIYVSNVLQELGLIEKGGALPLFSDSSAALAMTQNKGINHRTKHIALRHHFIRDLVDKKVLTVHKIGTAANPADLLTKATDKTTFVRHADTCTPRATDAHA